MTLRPLIRDLVRGPLRSPLDRRGGFDPDAAAWAAAVTAAGGTYSATTLNAVSIFVRSAKAAGYWTKLNRINLFCGDQLAACLVPLKAGGGSATETNVNFVSGDYSESTGLTGSGTKYLRTGLVPSVSLTANDTHMAVYDRSSVAGASGMSIGADQSGTGAIRFSMNAPFSDGKFYSDQYDNLTGRVVSAAVIGTPFGFLIGSRTASNASVAYRNGGSLASIATSGGSLPNIEAYVFAYNNVGAANLLSSHAVAGYSIGSGLTAGEVTSYNTHIQAFQTALGRNV